MELFGQNAKGYGKVNSKQIHGPFYCGLSCSMALPQFNMRLCGPTSTSTQVTVASKFAGDSGIVMQLNNNGDTNSGYLPIFDCSWISRFNGEEEKLLMGGLYRIRIESIIIVESCKNFAVYLKPLYFFDCMISGSDMAVQCDIKKQDIKIMKKLIKNAAGIEQYIKDSFNAFCAQRKRVVINLLCLAKFGSFVELLYIIEKDQIVFNTDVFCLFKNIKDIVIYCNEYGAEHPIKIFEDKDKKDSLFGVFGSMKGATITFKANHPSWIYKEFHDYRNNKELNFSIVYRFSQDKNEDLLIILRE